MGTTESKESGTSNLDTTKKAPDIKERAKDGLSSISALIPEGSREENSRVYVLNNQISQIKNKDALREISLVAYETERRDVNISTSGSLNLYKAFLG